MGKYRLLAALVAGALAVGTWIVASRLTAPRLAGDFPRPPDAQKQNAAFRKLLEGADAAARERPDSADDAGRLGMIYHANQFFEQAESAYRIAARLAPRDYRWPFCRALALEESGRDGEALALFETAVRLKPDYVPGLQKLGDTCFKQNRLDEADRWYGLSAAAETGSSLHGAFGQGRVAASRQNWHRVIELLLPLTRDYPSIRPPRQLLSEAYDAIGVTGKAAEERHALAQPGLTGIPPVRAPLTDEIVALSCSSTRLLKEAGLRSRFGEAAPAIKTARRAVEVDPADADARHFLARTLLDARGGDPESVEEALTQLTEGLRLKPDDRLPLWYFATFFFKQDKTESAVERLRTMLAALPEAAEAHYYLGVLAYRQRKTAEAVAHYEEALRKNPTYAEAWHKLGLIHGTQGRTDAALACLEKAVRSKPTLALARSNLGVALDQQGKTGPAIAQFQEALRLEPDDATTHMYLAIALTKSGRNEEAERHFREAVRITPDDAEAYYGLGCALANQRKLQEAAEALREALRLRPGFGEARTQLQRLGALPSAREAARTSHGEH